REPHMGEEFERVAVLPVGVGELEEIPALGGAGIIDEHIEAAELALHRLDECCGCALLAQVGVDDHGLAALAADRGRGLVEQSLIAPGEQEIAALIRKRLGDRAPDAAARAGHERDLSLQSKVHWGSLLLEVRRYFLLLEIRGEIFLDRNIDES